MGNGLIREGYWKEITLGYLSDGEHGGDTAPKSIFGAVSAMCILGGPVLIRLLQSIVSGKSLEKSDEAKNSVIMQSGVKLYACNVCGKNIEINTIYISYLQSLYKRNIADRILFN